MSEEQRESMADFEEEINASFVKLREGQLVTGKVISVEEDEVLVDLKSFSQGVIPASEYSDDPDFRAMDEIRVGDMLSAVVLYEDDMGRTNLSLKEAKREEGWKSLRLALEEKTVLEVKVKQTVPSGVVAYVEGVRGFIPASQLALSYVEEAELEQYVGQKIKVQVITVDEDADKLVMSAKAVAREEAAKEHEKKLDALQKGYMTEGVVVRIESYGCFVEFGDGLTGLVHISQICNKFLKSPKEVVKIGMTVKVKVLSVEEGKIRLSMKAAEDIAPEVEREQENVSMEYQDEEEATTSLAGLLKGIQLDK